MTDTSKEEIVRLIDEGAYWRRLLPLLRPDTVMLDEYIARIVIALADVAQERNEVRAALAALIAKLEHKASSCVHIPNDLEAELEAARKALEGEKP